MDALALLNRRHKRGKYREAAKDYHMAVKMDPSNKTLQVRFPYHSCTWSFSGAGKVSSISARSALGPACCYISAVWFGLF
jgi:hypothetical protein